MTADTPPTSQAREACLALLVELVRAALVSDEGFVARCRERGLAARSRLDGQCEAPPGLWDRAVQIAEADPEVMRREDVNPMLPAACPLDLSRLGAADFDFDACLHAIRESSSFG